MFLVQRQNPKGIINIVVRSVVRISVIRILYLELECWLRCVFASQELFGQDVKAAPNAENVEALCQLFSLIGKQLEAEVRESSAFDSYMARLQNVGNDSRLESRIRFMVRNVIELRANKWTPRREEVHIRSIYTKYKYVCFLLVI